MSSAKAREREWTANDARASRSKNNVALNYNGSVRHEGVGLAPLYSLETGRLIQGCPGDIAQANTMRGKRGPFLPLTLFPMGHGRRLMNDSGRGEQVAGGAGRASRGIAGGEKRAIEDVARAASVGLAWAQVRVDSEHELGQCCIGCALHCIGIWR